MAKKAKPTEEGEGGPKKKKGKLPIILVLVLVLGGGGFFMMKGKGKAAAKPAIEISEELVDIPEVLVNLRSENSYARMSLALQFEKSFPVAHMDTQKPVIRDAIISVVSSKTLGELSTPESKLELKEEIAEAINHSLHAMHPPKEGEAASSEKGKKEEGAESGHEGEKAKTPRAKRQHPDWDSDEGPLLKIYFSDFVTQ